MHGGSVSIFSPSEGACVEVSGEADIVQLFIDEGYAEAALDASFRPCSTCATTGCKTMTMRILVGSARRGPADALMVEQDLHAVALRIERHAARWRNRTERPLTLFRGGPAPYAFRRVEAMVETALDEARSPTLADMAAAVGLSVTHFVRAFRRRTRRHAAQIRCAATRGARRVALAGGRHAYRWGCRGLASRRLPISWRPFAPQWA